jgi:nitroreductase
LLATEIGRESVKLGLSADEVLTTTRAVRKRLDFSRPVEKEVLVECLDIATQAPTARNFQKWQWVFVTDATVRKRVGEVYREKFNIDAAKHSAADPISVYGTPDTRAERFGALIDASRYLTDNIERVPVLMIPCIEGRIETTDVYQSALQWGSITQAVWSFMLALRERGLGSVWTCIHLKEDGEQQVADILGIPSDEYTQVGLFPVAYTIGTDFRPAKRLPLDTIMHFDHW